MDKRNQPRNILRNYFSEVSAFHEKERQILIALLGLDAGLGPRLVLAWVRWVWSTGDYQRVVLRRLRTPLLILGAAGGLMLCAMMLRRPDDLVDQELVYRLFGAGPVGCFGALLFMLRERRRLLYGVLEFFFSLAAAAYALLQPAPLAFAHIAGLVGAMYLLVRSLDNIQTGVRSLLSNIEGARALFPDDDVPAAVAWSGGLIALLIMLGVSIYSVGR